MNMEICLTKESGVNVKTKQSANIELFVIKNNLLYEYHCNYELEVQTAKYEYHILNDKNISL